MMKKLFLIMAAFLALTTVAFAKAKNAKSEKIKIVTTIFPEYDWTKEILGDNLNNAELTLLIGNGVDLHSYQPSIKDMAKISTADIFIYVGGESDKWVNDALKSAKNKNMKVINLMETLGDKVKSEELKEGMQEAAHEHSHSHSSEIHLDDIKDRSLSEFTGEWKSLYPVLINGKLGEYVEHQAKDMGKSEKEMFKEISDKWNCGLKLVKVNGDKITLTYDDGKTVSGKYSYAGYAIKKNDEGKISNVRYKFESKDAGVPKYVMFNDHDFEPTKDVKHFHFYYGNNNFEEFMNSKVNSYFVDSKLSDHACEDLLLGHNHEAEEENDEHVWLSVRNAKILCKKIADTLCQTDSANAAKYRANYASYSAKLEQLDSKIADAVKNISKKTLVFADRFPFRYFVEDYGLDYFAAFAGCSAETEASFETVIFLAKKIDELGLNAIFKIEGSDGKIAQTVVQNSKNKNAKIFTLDSMQSVTLKQISSGASYLKLMEENLKIIEEAKL